MHLSLSIPTYPRSGNGWGFVAICPQGWGICPRIFIVFGIPIQNVGDLQHKIIPRGGEFVKRLANPHPCRIWGKWGVTMIGALCIIHQMRIHDYKIWSFLVPCNNIHKRTATMTAIADIASGVFTYNY